MVKILQFRGDKVERETIYFADPFPAPDWRGAFAEEAPVEQRRGDLPAHIAAGQLSLLAVEPRRRAPEVADADQVAAGAAALGPPDVGVPGRGRRRRSCRR